MAEAVVCEPDLIAALVAAPVIAATCEGADETAVDIAVRATTWAVACDTLPLPSPFTLWADEFGKLQKKEIASITMPFSKTGRNFIREERIAGDVIILEGFL
jgi:hypothetical protein